MGVVRTIIGKIRAKSASNRGEGASSLYNLETTNGAWLVGCFGFIGPLRQYFSLYRAVTQREGERGEKG